MRGIGLWPVVLLTHGLWADEVSLRVMEGRPVVDGVYVDGHGPYRFLIDTGTTLNMIDPALAQAAGLRATYRTEIISSFGKRPVTGAEGLSVTLADASAKNQKIVFYNMEVAHGLSGSIQGILGQSFFSRFDYLIDMRGRRLVFGKQDASGSKTRLNEMYERAVVSTSLGKMVLDSGAAQMVLFGLDGGANGQNLMRTISGFGFVGMIHKELIIEGRPVWQGQAVAIPQEEEPGVAGLIPINLFRAVYVSNSGKYLVFQ
jgi:hypothetical protein